MQCFVFCHRLDGFLCGRWNPLQHFFVVHDAGMVLPPPGDTTTALPAMRSLQRSPLHKHKRASHGAILLATAPDLRVTGEMNRCENWAGKCPGNATSEAVLETLRPDVNLPYLSRLPFFSPNPSPMGTIKRAFSRLIQNHPVSPADDSGLSSAIAQRSRA